MNTNLDTPAPADRQLVERCLDGDHAAYRVLVERHQGMVCALAYSACGNLARSEEVAQEVFIAAWKKLPDLQAADKLPGWLAGITRNLVRNAYRSQLRTPTGRAEELAPDLPSTEADPREQTIRSDEAGLMWRALESIPEKYREPMVLYYREQRSVGAVALALDLSEENVRQRLARGRALLTERVERIVGDALERSAPTPVFAGAVMLALPLGAVPTVAEATVAIAAGSGGVVAKTLTGAGGTAAGVSKAASVAGILPVMLAAFLDFLRFQSAYEAQGSGHARRRLALGHLAPKLLWGLLIGGYFLLHFLRRPGQPLAGLSANQFVYAVIGLLLLAFALSIRLRCWAGRLEAAAGSPTGTFVPPLIEKAFVYRSTRTLLGLPLLHVNLGGPGAVMKRTARGWIAVTDGIALGGLASVGGQLAVGPLCLGPAAIGILAFGVISFGAWAVGLFAVGLWAVGGGASGWFAAKGGLAISAHVASGERAHAPHANDDVARAYFQDNFLFSSAEAGLGTTLQAMWFVWVPSLVLIGWYLWRKKNGVVDDANNRPR